MNKSHIIATEDLSIEQLSVRKGQVVAHRDGDTLTTIHPVITADRVAARLDIKRFKEIPGSAPPEAPPQTPTETSSEAAASVPAATADETNTSEAGTAGDESAASSADTEAPTEADLERMNKAQLLQHCRQINLTVDLESTKAQLREAIQAASAGRTRTSHQPAIT
jgi:hypothetical protein